MNALFRFWHRRRWRANPAALAAFANQRPTTVITGGSEGIGLALARRLVKHRASITLVARDSERLETARNALGADNADADIIAIALDLTEAEAAGTLRHRLAERGYYVDELFNSAGIGLSGLFDEIPAEDLDRLTELNITALNRLTRACLPDMLVRGRGGIVNVASLGGLSPGPYQAAYYASKSYVISLSHALAHETRGMGVTISCIAPGPVETRFHARMDAERAFYRRFLPALSPARVANSTVFWYALGATLIIPGIFNRILGLALRVLPGTLTIPVVAFLLNPGGHQRDV